MDPSSQMAGSSNQVDASARIQDLKYLYASIANLSNFVSVKLSSDRNYHLWKTQMLCLMKSHNMAGIVEDAYERPVDSSEEKIMDQYDSLLKGWIFGSVSENVLGAIVDLPSAKDVWDRLKSFYDVTVSRQQGVKTADTKTIFGEVTTSKRASTSMDRDVIMLVSTETETEIEGIETETEGIDMIQTKMNLRKETMKGDWTVADSILKKDRDLVRVAISRDGSTILHTAVGLGNNDFVKNLCSYINHNDVLLRRNQDGSTALHIAAIVGNTYAANLLLQINKSCLLIKDNDGHQPIGKAFENMHLGTIRCLLKAIADGTYPGEWVQHMQPDYEIGVDLLVNAISAQEYKLASEIIEKFPELASRNDDVLMAIVKSFPRGDYEETLIDPSWKSPWELICMAPGICINFLLVIAKAMIIDICREHQSFYELFEDMFVFVLYLVLFMLFLVFLVTCVPILMFCLVFLVICVLWFKISKTLGEATTRIEKKQKMDEAEMVLQMVCDEIDKLAYYGTHHPYYTRPILEAACQNAYKVIDEILDRSPTAIYSTDTNGYDIIQLAVIHRSERIYNLIYDIGNHKNIYRTIVDSYKNNILHLAGRLAPLRELTHRTCAALKLQRELQWREEVKNLIFPAFINQENIFMETPDMVFIKEHENLVKEAEQWMKTTAESCSITAALITTIVFAAAITVPGGSNQDTGIPLFTKDIAFIIFAVSDAISLFASSTTLLVFLSILTARFSENEFLFTLPKRLLIGLCTLLLSAISMMVAFSATLYLVFCHQKPWMLAPICGLSLIPISFFVALQVPLIVELFQSTYRRKFGPRRRGKCGIFNPVNTKLFFG